MERLEHDALESFLGYFDHVLLRARVASLFPERDAALLPGWEGNARHRLGLLRPTCPSTLHWLFASTQSGVTLNGTPITGDINDYFTVDSSQVQPQPGTPNFYGSFYVTMVGNDLYLNYAAVPEPGSLLLMGIAGLGFGGMSWKKRRRKLAQEAAKKAAEEAAAPSEVA